MTISSPTGFPLAPRTGGESSPARVKEAAGQFEALLVAQMLKGAREAGGSSWLGTGEDEAGQTGVEMAEQEFARAIAKAGGLGLTAMVTRGLERAVTPAASSLPPDAAHTPVESAG